MQLTSISHGIANALLYRYSPIRQSKLMFHAILYIYYHLTSHCKVMENEEKKANDRLDGPVSESDIPKWASKEEASEDIEVGCCGGGPCSPETRPGWIILNILLCIVAGIIFGWCLEKGRGETAIF